MSTLVLSYLTVLSGRKSLTRSDCNNGLKLELFFSFERARVFSCIPDITIFEGSLNEFHLNKKMCHNQSFEEIPLAFR